MLNESMASAGRGQTEVRGREVTFPVEVPRGRRFFEVNKIGRVDTSMSPICASPKFRPNSLVELLGHERICPTIQNR